MGLLAMVTKINDHLPNDLKKLELMQVEFHSFVGF